MRKKCLSSLLAMTIILIISTSIIAQETVTPEEAIAKVKEAAAYLSENGDAVLVEFNDLNGPWVWKGTYVFVMDCDNDVYVGHPMENVLGKKISEMVDANGYYAGIEECEIANNPNGGWVEIMWPKLGSTEPVRKLCYTLRIPGERYTVGCGIYEPSMTVEELNDKLK